MHLKAVAAAVTGAALLLPGAAVAGTHLDGHGVTGGSVKTPPVSATVEIGSATVDAPALTAPGVPATPALPDAPSPELPTVEKPSVPSLPKPSVPSLPKPSVPTLPDAGAVPAPATPALPGVPGPGGGPSADVTNDSSTGIGVHDGDPSVRQDRSSTAKVHRGASPAQ
ncbi:MAG TPA: hypothetical protein VM324_04810 [Egibacteraceae bacterium]|nr:hypothetical protein [Egibacteraceae bacterium]